jgi:hypothetical protein
MKLLTDSQNFAVIQLDDRKFPGVLMQGDSLLIMCQNLKLIMENVETDSNLYDELKEVMMPLEMATQIYRETCVRYDIELPVSF